MKRSANAKWSGTGLEGKGLLNTVSGVFQDHPYSFKTRFKNEDGTLGTNPEELIMAAHAGCFNMALSFQLVGAGFTAESLDTTATLEMKDFDGHMKITSIHLDLNAKVPGISEDKFQELAKVAKENCPISDALSAKSISMTAALH